jgi:hypothetical protein
MAQLYGEEVVQKNMRKIILSVLLLPALGACSSTPDEEERVEDLYLRLRYLRAAFETSYADHNPASLDAVSRELRLHARRDLELFGRDLRKGSLRKKEIAAFVLAFSHNRKAQGWLIDAARDPDLAVRGIAIASLGLLQMSDTPIDVFRQNLNSPDWYLRQAALYGLRYQLKQGETGGLLTDVVKLLRDIRMDVRNEALIVLRRMRSKESISPIVEVSLKDSSPHVRQSAAITLSVFGEEGSASVPHLIETLRDDDTKVVEAAWTALRQITGEDFDRSYDRWRDWYQEEEDRYEYLCPDHPETSFDSPGQCPKCLGKLARAERPELYLCPVHSDVQAGHLGRCSLCHRRMVAFRPVYKCREHEDSSSVLAGPCLSCGKERIPGKKVFTCPAHPDVEAPQAGKCSRCEKALEPFQK